MPHLASKPKVIHGGGAQGFGLFDRDSDGYVTSHEVGVVIRSLGGVVTDAEIGELVKQFEEKSGMIDFGDFLALMATVMVKKESSDELLEAFRVFDRDGKGFISAAELRHVTMNLGEKLSEEDVDEMIQEADVAGTGQVDYTESRYFAMNCISEAVKSAAVLGSTDTQTCIQMPERITPFESQNAVAISLPLHFELFGHEGESMFPSHGVALCLWGIQMDPSFITSNRIVQMVILISIALLASQQKVL
ncbi:calmodulin [Elysia marginata]|uniref:Calmodulin n=1 Tax=Elysia marginata TaxID=1093978 RepID=A0AAV4HDA6_9GAST|nr:calmodulin [Elysia marginata]